ncbi:MAG: hypothetical protein ACLTD6_14265 [Clostridium paraputrificum]
MNSKFIGMSCKIINSEIKGSHRCILCNHIDIGNEVTFVSPICKTSNSAEGTYKSIGFDICLDSKKCNVRIISSKNLNNFKRLLTI